jgi:hypothetical protein
MINRFLLICSLLCFYLVIEAKENNQRSDIPKYIKKYNSTSFYVKLLDINARIYPDMLPDLEPGYTSVDVPRNYTLTMQVAVNTINNEQVEVNIEGLKNVTTLTPFIGNIEVNELLSVNVEGNSQTNYSYPYPQGVPPGNWIPYLIRLAPFNVLDVVKDSEGTSFNTIANTTSGFLLQLSIPETCDTGVYEGKVAVRVGNIVQNVPFSFKVYKTKVDSNYFLDCAHWLSELPENLKSGTPVVWWSEQHWKLLERIGKLLREDGNNMMFTPLVDSEYPLIETSWQNNKLSFDYTKFDRWILTFDTLGFKFFEGEHIKLLGTDLYIKNIAAGGTISLNAINMNVDCFKQTFLSDLNKHLSQKGMLNRYVQHIYDEPRTTAAPDEYKKYSAMLKRCMPGVKSIDAFINTPFLPQVFSDNVDIQVFNLHGMITNKNTLVKDRLDNGQGVWIYNTGAPAPPFPNRNLDKGLIEHRIWSWLCAKYKASGYLYWAVNEYRGVANEYQASIGPVPGGSQNPGHPPGNNWFYYRTSNGLVRSVRAIAFREGMVDIGLLNLLREHVQETAINNLINQVFRQGFESGINKGFEDVPANMNGIRKSILENLDAI